MILILDEIEDPHNFGAIIRSCDAFDVDGIIIKSRNQVPITMTVSKVSTGAIEYVRIAQVSNLSSAIFAACASINGLLTISKALPITLPIIASLITHF